MTPTPNQSPRDPPMPARSVLRDKDGNDDSVTVTVWSKVMSMSDLEFDLGFLVIKEPLI